MVQRDSPCSLTETDELFWVKQNDSSSAIDVMSFCAPSTSERQFTFWYAQHEWIPHPHRITRWNGYQMKGWFPSPFRQEVAAAYLVYASL